MSQDDLILKLKKFPDVKTFDIGGRVLLHVVLSFA